MTTIAINYEPETVPVTDERDQVQGIRVAMTIQTADQRRQALGLVIPPEGDDVRCWMPGDILALIDSLTLDAQAEVIQELAAAAEEPGRGGRIHLEAEVES